MFFLTPLKWVGWVATYFWAIGAGGAIARLFGSHGGPDFGHSDAAHLFVVGWGPFFFWYFLPLCRWVADAEVSYRLGLPEPEWRVRNRGSIASRIYQSVNRGIAAYGDTGTLVIPSDDGINDLGQTGGLPKSVVNPVGYRQIHVHPVVSVPHCVRCHAELLGGPRRCRSCGVYVHTNGNVDYEAQYHHTGSTELPPVPTGA